MKVTLHYVFGTLEVKYPTGRQREGQSSIDPL